VRTPAEDAQKLSAALGELAKRLRACEQGQAIFSREDVERILGERLAREQKRTRKAERERDELRARLDGDLPEDRQDRLGQLLHERGPENRSSASHETR
jgi:hypothetical protein